MILMELYPLLFKPILSERPWGGRLLETEFGKPLPPGQKIGESWEIYSTSVIENGELAGRTLRDALHELGDALGPREGDDFPLLVKFLDAHEWLSVQVHPNNEQAMAIEHQPRGKTECWYVLRAEPGAKLAFGASHAMTTDEYRAMVAAGQARDTLAYVPVQAGDFVYVPATTPHAIGPGIMIYELQQSSDTTYRVYDWDRVDKDGKARELHLEKAIQVMNLQPLSESKIAYRGHSAFGETGWVDQLIRGPYFALDRLRLAAAKTTFSTEGTCHVLTVIEGDVMINGVPVNKGRSTLIPAGLGQYSITQSMESGGATILKGWPTG